MAYKQLKTLYHTDKTDYEAIYKTRFNSPDTIYIGLNIGDFPAFYLPTSGIYTDIIDIYRHIKTISDLKSKLPTIAINQFIIRCIIDEIVITNNIEGVSSTRQEVSEILDNVREKDKEGRFYGLVRKYEAISQNAVVQLESCSDIRNIYDEIVLAEVISENPEDAPDGLFFRKGPVHVSSPSMKVIHTGVFPEKRIIDTMDTALAHLNNQNLNPLLRMAAFHYLLGYIHPFYNGNGRLNRFISSYLISKELDPLMAYRLSYTIKDNIAKYNNAFKTCNDKINKGDLTPFIEMFVSVIRQSTVSLLDALNKRYNRLQYHTADLDTLPGADNTTLRELYNTLIQAELFSETGVSMKELILHLNCSKVTVGKHLDVIRRLNVLKETKVGRKKYYGINLERIDQLKQIDRE